MLLIVKKYGTGEEVVRFDVTTAPIIGDVVALNWIDREYNGKNYTGTVIGRNMSYMQISTFSSSDPFLIVTITVS